MNLDIVDAFVYARTGQHLADVQRLILQGALQGKTYEEIADQSHYAVSYLKKVVGPGVWTLLSAATGETVSKTNFQAALERALRTATPKSGGLVQRIMGPVQDWQGAPDISGFCGRVEEIHYLKQWIGSSVAPVSAQVGSAAPSSSSEETQSSRCRLLLLSGMGGVGKTALAVSLGQHLQAQFDCTLWRSLRDAPPVQEVLQSLLTRLHSLLPIYPLLPEGSSLDEQLERLLDYLRDYRCLIVLDELETVLSGGELAGQYRQNYQGYRELLRRIGEDPHQSCLIVTSREQPMELSAIAGDHLPVRHYKLRGLSVPDATQLLINRGIAPTQLGLEDLVHRYRGNPATLRMIASTIQELFDGNIAPLLGDSTLVVNDTLLDLLNQQFQRLSQREQETLYWLAIENRALSYAELRRLTQVVVTSSSELIAALESLKRRSLLEKVLHPTTAEVQFCLEPVVMKFALQRMVEQVCADVLMVLETQSVRHLGLFRSHALGGSICSTEDFSSIQMRLILQPLIERLQDRLGEWEAVKQALHQVQRSLDGKPAHVQGFATANIQHLLRIIED